MPSALSFIFTSSHLQGKKIINVALLCKRNSNEFLHQNEVSRNEEIMIMTNSIFKIAAHPEVSYHFPKDVNVHLSYQWMNCDKKKGRQLVSSHQAGRSQIVQYSVPCLQAT